jgi:hypothetical protein
MGKAGAEVQLNKLLENYAVRAGTELSELKTTFNVDNEVSFPVYRFPYPSFPGLWLGSPFTMAEARFVSFIDNYMVFSNSEKGLHEYLRNIILGTTLAKDSRYQGFKQVLPTGQIFMFLLTSIKSTATGRNFLLSRL